MNIEREVRFLLVRPFFPFGILGNKNFSVMKLLLLFLTVYSLERIDKTREMRMKE